MGEETKRAKGGSKRSKTGLMSPLAFFLLSFPLAVVAFLIPSLDWGSSSDDGWYYYGKGLLPWSDIFGPLFIPGYLGQRIFIFGEDRPVQHLFYKLMYEVGASSVAFHVCAWVLTYVSCYFFAWGLMRLISRFTPVRGGAVGFLAALLWWQPATQFSAATALVNAWLLGFLGLFWALAYSNFNGFLAVPWRRWALAVFFAFLACQTLENAWPHLVWTSLWLVWVRIESKQRANWKDWLPDLAPLAIVISHMMLFRSFSPETANRFEITTSLSIGSFLRVSQYYLLMGLHAVAHPFVDWMGLEGTPAGIGPQPYPFAFLMTSAGLFLAVRDSRGPSKKEARIRVASWVLLLGGLAPIAPYLAIQNRQFIYYGLPLNAFIAAFLVFRTYTGKGVKTFAAKVYLLGVIIASGYVMLGWNFTKFYGQGLMRDFHDQVRALPGASQCSSEHPCCLEIPGRTWGRHEWLVDWVEDAGKRPPFVQPGMPCEKTLKVP
jgi:hypothetical protein